MKINNTDMFKGIIPALPNPHHEVLIELISNKEAIIEGAKGIIECTDCRIKINCKQFILTFEGFNLGLSNLYKDSLRVTGKFTYVSFSEI